MAVTAQATFSLLVYGRRTSNRGCGWRTAGQPALPWEQVVGSSAHHGHKERLIFFWLDGSLIHGILLGYSS